MRFFTYLVTFLLTIGFGSEITGQEMFEVRVSEVLPRANPIVLQVEMRAISGTTFPNTNADMQDIVVTLNWKVADNIDLGSIDNSAGYNITKTAGETVDGVDEYQIFSISSSGFFPENWTLNTWYDIFNVDVTAGSSGEVVVLPSGVSTEPRITYLDFTTFDFVTDVPDVVGSAPLPIKLHTFKAEPFGDRSGKLDWTTTSEVNGSHFEVQRSVGHIDDFYQIGRVEAAGESTEELAYEFIDREINLNRSKSNTVYYRLKLVDLDGSYEYSDIRSITFDADNVSIGTYPNPTNDKVFVNMSAPTDQEVTDGIIFDATGKILRKVKISTNGITTIDVNDLPLGINILQVVLNNSVYNKKIMVID